MVVVVVVASNKEEVAEYVLQHSIECIYRGSKKQLLVVFIIIECAV